MDLSIGKWINILWYIHKMEYSSAIKRNELDTSNNIDEFVNNYIEWKKPDKTEYILYDCIYMKVYKMQSNIQ